MSSNVVRPRVELWSRTAARAEQAERRILARPLFKNTSPPGPSAASELRSSNSNSSFATSRQFRNRRKRFALHNS